MIYKKPSIAALAPAVKAVQGTCSPKGNRGADNAGCSTNHTAPAAYEADE